MFSRDITNALLPEGQAWTPLDDSDYDKLINGIAANSEAIRLQLEQLRYIRDPRRTSILSDLENEYAVVPTATATDDERRERLAIAMFRRSEIPTYELLEEKLRAAGFDNIHVYENSPVVNPNIFLAQSFNMVCGGLLPGGNDAQCGEPEAYCAFIGGEFLVNGEIYIQGPNYSFLCGEVLCQCGEDLAYAGQYDGIYLIPIQYDVPPTGYWPMVFFIGGDATRDPVTGELTEIQIASIQIERKYEFRRIILKYKPMASWAGLVVVYQ
jgi:hypothetical protein